MIADSDHPVPIDLETILQPASADPETNWPEAQAFEAATDALANSVMTVGLLPAYGKSTENNIFAIGGMAAWTTRTGVVWSDINTDQMRPAKVKQSGDTLPNLPNIADHRAMLGDHIVDFIQGFEEYARFLRDFGAKHGELFEKFAGLPVRRVLRPTRIYSMLLQRLRDVRTMHDGATWSAQADFLARFSDWDRESEVSWPLLRSERATLLTLNVPHFVTLSDGVDISDATGLSVQMGGTPGLHRARARVRSFDGKDIAWQVAIIRQNTTSLARSDAQSKRKLERSLVPRRDAVPTKDIFVAEASEIASHLTRYAIRRGPSAAWIGLDWLGDSDVSQLMPLGLDLYNGTSGIAVFLAAHAFVTGQLSSRDLALAAVSHLRRNLQSRNAARLSRSLGVGGGTGVGSIVYALSVMSKCLDDRGLLTDAQAAAELISDELIAADKELDVIAGSAGGILGLLRLYRDCQVDDVLKRAIKCGEHIIAQPRVAIGGHGSWLARGLGARPLNGMSHGAAGYAYALASLATATGRNDFAAAAAECIAFEDATYDPGQSNWPDFRAEKEQTFLCQWCHGAPGIGLSRIAISKRLMSRSNPGCMLDSAILTTDVCNALDGIERGWPGHVDTLCCGTLGGIELLWEAGALLGRKELRDLASRRLIAVLESAHSSGDFRWNAGGSQFNLGLFRGIAGVGYTFLRQVDPSLPNVLIWE